MVERPERAAHKSADLVRFGKELELRDEKAAGLAPGKPAHQHREAISSRFLRRRMSKKMQGISGDYSMGIAPLD